MAVIFDTPFVRPDVGVHQLHYSAVAARGYAPVAARRNVVAPALPQRRRAATLEARWAPDDNGQLTCLWQTIPAAWPG